MGGIEQWWGPPQLILVRAQRSVDARRGRGEALECAPATVEWCCGTDVALKCAPCDCARVPRRRCDGAARVSEFAVAPRRASGPKGVEKEVLAAASWRRRPRTTAVGECRVSATGRDGALEECGDSRSSATRRDGALGQGKCRSGDQPRNTRGFARDGGESGGGIERPGTTTCWTGRAVTGSSPTTGADTAVDHRRSGGRAGQHQTFGRGGLDMSARSNLVSLGAGGELKNGVTCHGSIGGARLRSCQARRGIGVA